MKSNRKLTIVGTLAVVGLFACSHAGRDLGQTLYKVNGEMPSALKAKKGRSIASNEEAVTLNKRFNLYNGAYPESNKPVTIFKGIDGLPVQVTVITEDFISCSTNTGYMGQINQYTVEFLIDSSDVTIQCQNLSGTAERHILGVQYTFQKKAFDYTALKDSKHKELSEALRAFTNKNLSSQSPQADQDAYFAALDLLKKESFAKVYTLQVLPNSEGGFAFDVDGNTDRLTYAEGFRFLPYDAVTIDEIGGEVKVGNAKKKQAKYSVQAEGLPKNLVKGKFPMKGENAYALVCKELRSDKSVSVETDKWTTILGAAASPGKVRRGKAYSNIRCYVNAPASEVSKGNVWGMYTVKISHLPYNETVKLVEGALKGEEEALAKASKQANDELVQQVEDVLLAALNENAALDSQHAQAVAAKKATEDQIAAAVEKAKKELEEQYGTVLTEQTAKAEDAQKKAEEAEKKLEEVVDAKAELVRMTRAEEEVYINEKFQGNFPKTKSAVFYPAYIEFHVRTKITEPQKSSYDEIGETGKRRVHVVLSRISPIYCTKDFMIPGKEGQSPLFWEGPTKYKPSLFGKFTNLKTATEVEDVKKVDEVYLMPYANLPYFLDAMKDLKESVYKTKKPNSAERYLKEIRLYAKKKEKDTELLCDSNAVVKDSKEVERLTFTRDISSTTFIYSRSYWQSREELEYGGEATKRELFKPERIEMKYRPNVSKDANAEIKALTIRGTLYKNSGSEHPFFKCGEVRKKKVYVEPKHVDDNYDRKLTVGTLFPAFDDDGEVLPGEPVLPPSDGNYVCPQKRAK